MKKKTKKIIFISLSSIILTQMIIGCVYSIDYFISAIKDLISSIGSTTNEIDKVNKIDISNNSSPSISIGDNNNVDEGELNLEIQSQKPNNSNHRYLNIISPSIDNHNFYSSVKKINIFVSPNSVINIDEDAFSKFENLESLRIWSYSSYLYNIEKNSLPKSIKSIDFSMYYVPFFESYYDKLDNHINYSNYENLTSFSTHIDILVDSLFFANGTDHGYVCNDWVVPKSYFSNTNLSYFNSGLVYIKSNNSFTNTWLEENEEQFITTNFTDLESINKFRYSIWLSLFEIRWVFECMLTIISLGIYNYPWHFLNYVGSYLEEIYSRIETPNNYKWLKSLKK